MRQVDAAALARAPALAHARGRSCSTAQSVHARPTKEVARILGLLPQSPVAPEGIAVADLVGRGRHPHQKMLARWSAHDYEVVADALDATGTTDLADRSVDELSGGQRQRVWIAMALAQETDILLLDEPTTFLDVAHQVEVLDLLTDLSVSRGTTIVMVLHDLNLAARYADELVADEGGPGARDRRPAGRRDRRSSSKRSSASPIRSPSTRSPASRWSHPSGGTMSAETTTERPTYVLARAEVRAVEPRLADFVRVTFGGDELDEFGTPGEVFDARIKLIFPPASGILPDARPRHRRLVGLLPRACRRRSAVRCAPTRSAICG